MFLKTDYAHYSRSGEQLAGGRFLVLMQPKTATLDDVCKRKYPIKALVRYCKMSQMGAWMIGKIRVKGISLMMSGSYGGDGLLADVPMEVYNMGVELPAELVEAWNNGGGHNSAGSEAPAMRSWAIKTFPAPKKRRW
ncbi:MAG: hypothetical protein WCM93_14425 [Bacteroidota bacterium]